MNVIIHTPEITLTEDIISTVIKTLNDIKGIDAVYTKKGYTDRKIEIYTHNHMTNDDILAMGVLIGTIETSRLLK